MENIQNSKSQLAKLLATENITVQHKAGAKTASFDVKNRVLVLPVWRVMSDDLYDLLVIHEVGHALDTPADGWIEELSGISQRVLGHTRGARAVKNFMNVIEDARIDKRQKRRFPGSRRNYIKGYKELFEKDFFGTLSRDVNTMKFIDRLNVYFKGGAMSGVRFSAAERPFVKRIEDAETFEEVLTLTEEIFAFSKEQEAGNEPEPEPEDDIDFEEWDFDSDDSESDADYDYDDREDSESDDDGEGESGAGDDADETDDQEDESGDGESDDADDGEADDGDANDSDDAEDDEDAEGGSPRDTGVGGGDSMDKIPDSETERNWQKNAETLVDDGNSEFVYATLPTPNYKNILDDYKVVLKNWRDELGGKGREWMNALQSELNDWKRAENASISFMIKEFETRKAADSYAKIMTAKTGVIDTNKLHSYKYSDDIFRRNTIVPAGKNHGFVMFLDWSGSMTSNLRNTVKQLLSQVMFCKRVQIPFDVYLFRDTTHRDGSEFAHDYWSHNKGELEFRSFKLRNVLSSRMNLADLNMAMLGMWYMSSGQYMYSDCMHGTPLNAAIIAASKVVNDFKVRHKTQITNVIFLTDGGSDGCNNIHRVEQLFSGKNVTTIMHDTETKKDYNLGVAKHRYGWDYHKFTSILLRNLKDRTGANLIGFYLFDSSFNSLQYEFLSGVNSEYLEKMKASWSDDGFIPVSDRGYDEYYILNPVKMRVVKNELKVSSEMTRNRVAKEFMKFSEKKTVNRVLLRKFIEKVA